MVQAKTVWLQKIFTMKAPNITHLSLLTSVGYNKKKQIKKVCTAIIHYLHRVQNENFFQISSNFDLKCTIPVFKDNENSPLTLRTFCKLFNNFSLMNCFYKIYQGKQYQIVLNNLLQQKLDSK